MRVLVVAPHMDDEVLGPGATIARHVDKGDAVTVCIVANRAYDHTYDDAAIEAEKEACRQAKKVLGYQELEFLDQPDEQLDRSIVEIVKPLERVYEHVRPEVVYTCHRGDANQDHPPVFRATVIVARPIGPRPPRRLLAYEVPSSTDQMPALPETVFLPNHFVAVSESQLARKLDAMRCYEREARSAPHPRSPEAIETYARRRGLDAGAATAEAFQILRDVRLERDAQR